MKTVTKFISKFLFVTLIILPSHNAFAGAWLMEKGRTANSESFYFSLPSDSAPNFTISGIAAANAIIKNTNSRFAGTSEFRYGYSDDLNLIMKLDYGYVRDQFELEVKDATSSSLYEFDLEYTTLSPYYGIQKKIGNDHFGVLSAEFLHYPGEYVIAEDEDYLIRQQGSVEARLLYGKPFKADINFFNLFGGEGVERWHYYDMQMGLRYFYEQNQMQWEFDTHFGFRPADNWLVVLGMYHTLHGVSYIKKPVNAERINDIVNNTTLNASQRNVLRDILRSNFEQGATYRNHELNYKISYALTQNKEIALEGMSNFLIRKPFENNTVVLSYAVKF